MYCPQLESVKMQGLSRRGPMRLHTVQQPEKAKTVGLRQTSKLIFNFCAFAIV
jgi:hypothetical protein